MIWKCISEAKPFTLLRPKLLRKLYRKDVYIRRWLLAAYIDNVYIHPWPTECKTRSRMRNTFKMYIYALNLQNEISSAKSRVHPGRIYVFGTQRVNEKSESILIIGHMHKSWCQKFGEGVVWASSHSYQLPPFYLDRVK